jgi:hypothetical protein
VTVTVNNQAAPLYTKPDGKEAKQNAANERMQIAIAISTGLLVLVGFLTCGVIAWQSWETRRSIEVQIAKERARIRVKVDDLKLVLRQTGRFNAVNCTLINSGPTEGFVDDFRAKLIRVPHKTISVSYDECRRWSISDPIPAKSQMNKSAVIVLEPEMFLEDKDVISINKSESFIHFYGIVKYHDMFDRKRQSTIHLRWTMLWGGAIKGQIMESWQPDGKDEENQDT